VAIDSNTKTTTGRQLNSLDEIISGRRSVRQFQQRAVPREYLERMLEAARWAPSPHGRQPWRFAVVTRPELKQALATQMGDEWRRNLEMDGQPDEIVTLRLEKSRQRILNAPAIIIPCLYLEELDTYPDEQRQAHETTMAIQSIGAAIQNMLLMAYSLGLDTGWMCAPLFCPGIAREALELDHAFIPQAMIIVGYAAADPKRKPHRPIEELIVRFD